MMDVFTVASKPDAKPIDPKHLLKLGLDAVSLLGHAKYDLSL